MANQFSSKDIELKSLLIAIDKDKCQLPEFQRPWVWSDDQIRALLSSGYEFTKKYRYQISWFVQSIVNPRIFCF